MRDMAMNPRIPLVTLVAAMTLGLTACGSSGDGSSGGLAKADLAKQADAICQTAVTAAGKIQAPAGFGTRQGPPQEAAAYLGKIAPITHNEADDLAALKPADDVKADYADMVAGERKLASFLDGLIAKAKAADPSGLDDLKRSVDVAKPFVAAANKVGASVCAKS
jgi:hypothetical protein